MTTATDNILKLAALQDNGKLPPAAEDAIALDFAERHQDELRYVALWGRWLDYDDVRWQRDDTLVCSTLRANLSTDRATRHRDAAERKSGPLTCCAAPINFAPSNVRFTPESRHWDSVAECPFCAKSGHLHCGILFDQFVGASYQLGGNLASDCLRGLKVEHQFKSCRLLDGKVAGVGATQDLREQTR